MKTICYVDGYNLYYGCLKNTPYKWLDIFKLFSRILNEQNPTTELVELKFFTAPIKTKLASQGALAGNSQADYHRALQHLYSEKVSVIEGYFNLEEGAFLEYLTPPDKTKRVTVWRLEEKQTDVNIAITAYRDALKGRAEQVVFVSNDTDLEPALSAIKEDFGATISIGVIFPIRERVAGATSRPPNNALSKHATWTRRNIRNEELAACVLNDVIPTNKKPIRKPSYW